MRLSVAATLCLLLGAMPPALATEVLSDRFDGSGNSIRWKRQEQRGTITPVEAVAGRSDVVRAIAGRKQGNQVGKAALIAPFEKMTPGTVIVASAWFYIPSSTPRNSIILMDLECKKCGMRGNPGLRLYLRDGRPRVDRKKIGEKHAWVSDRAPVVPSDRWFQLTWTLRLGMDAETGMSVVTVDGREALRNTGRTLPPLGDRSGVDRLQVGLTANSNATSTELYFDDVQIELHR